MNWFRKGDDGKFLWPGYGENSRVLKWVVERVAGTGESVDTPIGRVPTPSALDTTGLDIDDATLEQLLSVDAQSWRAELPQIEDHYASVGDSLPAALTDELRGAREAPRPIATGVSPRRTPAARGRRPDRRDPPARATAAGAAPRRSGRG